MDPLRRVPLTDPVTGGVVFAPPHTRCAKDLLPPSHILCVRRDDDW